MKIRWTLALSAVVLFLFSGFAQADTIKTDYDHNANFSQIHTYSWGQVKTSDPFYVDRIKQAVDKQLQSKGWQLVPEGGQAVVFAMGNVKNEQEVETNYNGFGPGWGGGWGWGGWGWRGGGFGDTTTSTVNQPVGSLVIDIFDSNKKLLYRGITTRDVSNKSKKNTEALNKDIGKMFKDFPPKAKS